MVTRRPFSARRLRATLAGVLAAAILASPAYAAPSLRGPAPHAPAVKGAPSPPPPPSPINAPRSSMRIVPMRTIGRSTMTTERAPAHEVAKRPTLGERVRIVATNAAHGLEANFVGTIATSLALSPNHEIHFDPQVAGTFWIVGTAVATLVPSVSRAIGAWWSSLKRPKAESAALSEADAAHWAKPGENEALYVMDGEAARELPEVKQREHAGALDVVKRELSSIGYGLKLAAIINAVGMPICYVLYGTQFSVEGTGVFISATLAAPHIRSAAIATVKKVASFFRREKPATPGATESLLDVDWEPTELPLRLAFE